MRELSGQAGQKREWLIRGGGKPPFFEMEKSGWRIYWQTKIVKSVWLIWDIYTLPFAAYLLIRTD